jgi:short-subunit dehydrogenase
MRSSCCYRIPRASPSCSTALVTGGCSGIGLELAALLAEAGFALVLVSNRDAELAAAARALASAHGVAVHPLTLDLSLPGAAARLHARVRRELALDVHVLCLNAGFFFFGEVASADPLRAEAMLQVHVTSASLLALLFARDMRERRSGFILFTSSISAWGSFPGIAFYGATKHYINSFALSLASELCVYGVGVTALCPGATATALYEGTSVPAKTAARLGVMMRARDVARAGLGGLFARRALVVPGLLPPLFAFFMALLPFCCINFARRRVPWLPRVARADGSDGAAAGGERG